jgi:hypothetical protein
MTKTGNTSTKHDCIYIYVLVVVVKMTAYCIDFRFIPRFTLLPPSKVASP